MKEQLVYPARAAVCLLTAALSRSMRPGKCGLEATA